MPKQPPDNTSPEQDAFDEAMLKLPAKDRARMADDLLELAKKKAKSGK